MEPWLQTIVGDVDPEAVTALDLDGNGPAWAGRDPLEAVAFLRAFPNLEELVLASQALDSPPPAAAWPHLSVLDCADNLIDDLAPLATPSALTSLNLAFNELRDLTPLAQQPQLRELNLGHNQIKDVAPLASLTALETLVLSGNRPLHAIAPLAGLKALQYLYLRQCRLASLEALAAHPALVHLSCVLTEPRLLAPLQSCPHLTSLDPSG
jgi:internalin A